MPGVFISHASVERERALEVRDWLLAEGLGPVFLSSHAEDGMTSGEDWYERLATELRDCRALVALLSPAWQDSHWCFAEWVSAGVVHKPTIPVAIVASAPEKQRPHVAAVYRRQGVDWDGDGERAKLRRALLESAPAEPVPPALCTLPSRVKDFTGRETDLVRLAGILTAEGRAALSSVGGMAGVGKTSLALEVALEVAPHFPDGVLFLDLMGFRQPLDPWTAMTGLMRQIDPGIGQLPDGVDALQPHYRRLLAGRRMLLVLDNASDPDQVGPLLPPETVAALVTSRNRIQLPGGRLLHLEVLPEPEAIELLRTVAGRELADPDLATIVKACGYLPIALRAAGQFLAGHPDWSVEEYLAELAADRFAALPEVDRVLQLSLEVLGRERPEILERFRMLAVFPGSFDRPAAAAVWALDERATRKTLDDLLARSLLLLDRAHATPRYRLHDLYRELAGAALDETLGETAAERHAEHYGDVHDRSNRLYREGGANVLAGLQLFDLERINIETAHDWAVRRCDGHDPAARWLGTHGVWRDIVQLRLTAREQIRWLEHAVASARRSGRRGNQGAALGNLGLAWVALGKARKAVEFFEQQLAIACEIGDRWGEGFALGNLGLAWAALGKARKAVEFYEQHLVIAREIGDRRGEGQTLGNMGIAWAALGEVRKSLKFYEQNLAIAREIGDRWGEGAALGNMGIAWAALGDLRKAIEIYDQQLAIAREIGDRPGEGRALGSLGNAWARLGELRRAIGFHEQVLAIMREVGDRRGEGTALGNMGMAWAALGELRGAMGFHEQVLAIKREVGDRWGEAAALANMALAYNALGERREAMERAKASLVVLRQIEHPARSEIEAMLREWGVDPDAVV
jgi:tetratricopeptide (TPR) repeat protein